METFDLAALGNWLYSWVQPSGAIHGFHNHSVWGDNPLRWPDYTSGYSTFAAPILPGLAQVLSRRYDERGQELLERMMRYQAHAMRDDGEYLHIGFQAGELAKVGLIHNMVPALSLLMAAGIGKEFLHKDVVDAARESALRVLTQGSLHYGGGRAGVEACCNQDYARIWAKLLLQKYFLDDRFEQQVQEDLDYMVDHFHISGVPDEDCDGTKRALLGKDQLLLEPAEYYGLMIVPLCIGYELFGREKWLHAAVRLCNHVVRSSFLDEENCRRVHRAYYAKFDGSWGRLTQPMQIQGNGLTLYGISCCARLTGNRELEKFLAEMEQGIAHYQTKRGFLRAATGWDTEADVVPATAWQAHDFFYFAHRLEQIQEEFWDRFFAPVKECTILLSNNCLWMEDGQRWTIQDYFSRSVYQIYGRKDRERFGRDLSWTGEKNDVEPDYLWGEALPRMVLNDDCVTPLRPLPAHAVVYNFSRYRWIPQA